MRGFGLIMIVAAAACIVSVSSSCAEDYPPDVRAKLELCFQPKDAAALSAAIEACTTLLSQSTWDTEHRARIYMSRGNAYDVSGNATQAIADYGQAIALSPRVALFYYNRGYVYQRVRDDDRAKADFEQAVQIDPKLALAHYYLGLLALRHGDFAAAVASFDRTIALNPNMANAYLYRGTAYGKLGNGGKAMVDVETAVRLDPSLAKSIQIDGKPMN